MITCKRPRRVKVLQTDKASLNKLVVYCRPYDYVGRYGTVVADVSIAKKRNKCVINWFGVDKGYYRLDSRPSRIERYRRRIPTPKNAGFGAAAYKKVEQWMKEKGKCSYAELSPASEQAENFWGKRGYYFMVGGDPYEGAMRKYL